VVAFSLLEVGGCTGSQIVESAGLGKGLLKFGLPRGVLEAWIGSLEG
jgi:hypothetical protein